MAAKNAVKPQYKFGDEIIIDHNFYGNIEGTIQDYDIVSRGIWPFRKHHILYRVMCTIHLGNEVYDSTLITEECFIKKKPAPLRPV